MKLFSRITAAAILAAPVVFGSLIFRPSIASSPGPITRALLTQRGYLKIAVPTDAWRDLLHRPDTNHFDYDLLEGFASEMGVGLRMLHAAGPEEALQQLRSGWADAAVLPYDARLTDDIQRAAPCAVASEAEAPEERSDTRPTLAVYFRDGRSDVLELINGAVPRLAQADGGGGLFEHYCFEQSFARAEREIEPIARAIAHYARIMAKCADEVGLDWRLVAALIYEESGFQVHAVSSKGARGLMQLMPWVPGEVGVRSVANPESNIRAGVLYLGRLSEIFSDSRGSDRLALVLAAYLLGPGHILDARELARQAGRDPDLWHAGLEQVLPLLESPNHYRRTRMGYAQGLHAVVYVNRILERYEAYKQQIGLPPGVTAQVRRDGRPA